MKPITLEETVSRSLPIVFEFFTDLRRAADRVRGIDSLEVLTDGPVQAGTRFRETRRMHGKSTTEELVVERITPNDRIVITADTCGCRFESQYRFVDLGGGQTLVELTVVCQPHTLFAKLLAPMTGAAMGKAMQKMLADDMSDLKAAAERGG